VASLDVPAPRVDVVGTAYAGLDYYDATFRDARWLFVNAGAPGLTSVIYAIDTTMAPPATVVPIVQGIPGASGGLAFDADGNLVTGIGYDAMGARTGEITVFAAADVDTALAMGAGGALDYEDDGYLVANNLSSAASLGFDADGNLLVGGGDVFGTTGNYGGADLVDASVITRVLMGGAPLDPSEPSEYARLEPDPCANDDSTRVLYVEGVELLLVSANRASLPPTCETVDWSGPSSSTTLDAHFPPSAPDDDGDGVPNGIDPDFGARRVGDRDELWRLVQAFDADAADPSFDSEVDFVEDTRIDEADFGYLRDRWGGPL
jgi:hypothetical protein